MRQNIRMPERLKQPFERVAAFWPAGAAVLAATDAGGGPFRLTVSSCTPVSMDPPLVSLALHAQSSRLPHFVPGAAFSLHLLDQGQGAWTKAPGEACLAVEPGGALAVLECRTRTVVEAGDHHLIVADVHQANARAGRPLVYWRRAFWRLDVRHVFLADEPTLDAFVAAFHERRLPAAAWTHGAHVAACAYHAWDHDAAQTLAIMRPAIKAFNESVGGQNTATAGYHETLTRLWATVVANHLRDYPSASRWEAVCSAVERFGEDRDLHRLYYTHDVVGDTRARAEWVPPDIIPATDGFSSIS